MIDRLDWDRWLMMGMIGITIGIVGFLLHQALHFIGSIKWYRASQLLRDVSNIRRYLSLARARPRPSLSLGGYVVLRDVSRRSVTATT